MRYNIQKGIMHSNIFFSAEEMMFHHVISQQIGMQGLCQSKSTSQAKIQKKNKIIFRQKVEGKGKWNKHEQILYINFLKQNLNEMSNKIHRKSKKVFLKMSRQIKSRTADQCRSHHQKMLKYHKSLGEVVKFYELQILNQQRLDSLKSQIKKQTSRTICQGGFYLIKSTEIGLRIEIEAPKISLWQF